MMTIQSPPLPSPQLPYQDLALPEPVQAALRSQLATLLPEPSPSAVSYGLSELRVVSDRIAELTFSAVASEQGSLPSHVVLHAPCGPAGPRQRRTAQRREMAAVDDGTAAAGSVAAEMTEEDEVSSMGVAKLKAMLDELGVDKRGLVEKSEMREAVRKVSDGVGVRRGGGCSRREAVA